MSRLLPPTSRQVTSSRYINLRYQTYKSSALQLACAGREFCEPEYHLERKSFPCYAIEFVLKGRGHVNLDGRHYPLYPGILYCYGSHTVHEMRCDPAQPLLKYFVDFFGDEAKKMLTQSGLSPGHAVQTLEIENYRSLFEQILTEGSRMTLSSEKICDAYLRVIILKAADAVKPSLPRQSSSADNFFRCRDFIDTHYLRLHNLADIAEELHSRPAQLCRLFQQFNQPSPFQYLTHRKMNRAAELLIEDRLSVKNIALELGYDDPYHFSRLFKRRFGHSPKNFTKLSWRLR